MGKAMRITIACIHYPVASGRYVADAFIRLGHEVKTIGQSTGGTIWGQLVHRKYVWVSASSIAQADPFWPDLVIVMDSDPAIWNEVAAVGFHCPIVVYGVDNHVRTYENDLFQHKFLAHYHGAAYPVDSQRKDMTWLPCAADTHTFTPSQIPWDERDFDIAFVGVFYPRRAALIERLRAEGFKVFAATGLVYAEYQQAYANSRISLCVSAAGDVAQRIFETAAIGCTVLTDLLHDLVDYETNRKLGLSGFAVYQDDDNCIQMARDLLTSDRALAAHGAGQLQTIVRAKHSWEARCQVVVDWFTKEYGGNVVDLVVPADAVTVASVVDVKNVKVLGMEAGEVLASDEAVEFNGFTVRRFDGEIVKLVSGGDPVVMEIIKKPFLNLGCGKTHFPSAKPDGHELVADALYSYPLWVNVDKVDGVGADKTFDLFTYPWPLEDNSFDGALLSHIVEHIPHEIKTSDIDPLTRLVHPAITQRVKQLAALQDGWYAFFSELYRVLTPGAIVHIVSPYGFSDGGITDPSHTRYLTMNTFTHSMTPEIGDGSTFKYNNGGINFQMDGEPVYRLTPYAKTLNERTGFDYAMLMGLYNNICYDMYLKLRCVK